MNNRTGNNIILIGFSTTGKSVVGREVARQLGWELVDTDEEIVRLSGKSIAQIFAEDGEEYFRRMERQVLAKACKKEEKTVIVTGGGVILDPENRELMKKRGMIVCLEATPETIYQRLLKDTAASGPLRPLLAVADPLQRIHQLKEYRQPYYAIADWTVHTDNLTLDEVFREVMRSWYYWNRAHQDYTPRRQKDDLACEVVTATEYYPIFIGWGLLYNLADKVNQAGLSGTIYLISDETVSFIYGTRVTKSLQNAGFVVNSFVVPPGEATKTLDTATRIYDWLVEHRAERRDVIVALGGGMVGDLAGFVAATYLRGLALVQVPTTLVAMVDAAIGGKTAVNHPQAKNIIGAFYQPRLVIADVETLSTLSRRELVSGWAEVAKHGLILDKEYFEFLENNADRLRGLEPEITTEAIKRSVAIKAKIVGEDEKERGRRTLLNYGHTVAHGLEAATNYERFLHGEAVAIGMMGAAMLSHQMGLLEREVVERQRALLEGFGLPTTYSGVDLETVLKTMELDKKVEEKLVRWVLLTEIGQAVIRDDVPPEQVVGMLGELMADK